jgi:hypothetical protein
VYRVLPAALARDQPQAAAEAQACFEVLPDWDLELLAELEPQGQVSRGPLLTCSLCCCSSCRKCSSTHRLQPADN